jgi:biopolymer transport protein ExbD
MALVNGDLLWRKPPVGILALTSGRNLKAISFDPWLKPLVLRIDAKERWFLDGEPVTPEAFPAALKKLLSRRPDWFVYLEADPNLDYRAPARAMDMIQGLHAKVILMTPGAPRVTGR